MPVWVEAGLWGLLGGAALVLGALVAWFVRVPQAVIASVMVRAGGNQTQAADMLGMNRNTLRAKLTKYDIR